MDGSKWDQNDITARHVGLYMIGKRELVRLPVKDNRLAYKTD
jgi:hypothetical protein